MLPSIQFDSQPLRRDQKIDDERPNRCLPANGPADESKCAPVIPNAVLCHGHFREQGEGGSIPKIPPCRRLAKLDRH